VAKLDPTFRDVAARVKALGGGPGRPPARPEPPRAANGAAAPHPAPAVPAPAPRPAAPVVGPKKNIGYL
jgi:hypothetical protein